jgi:hypothetical protein
LLVQNLAIPAIVFGLIGMRIASTAMWNFTHPPKTKMFWWYAHLQGNDRQLHRRMDGLLCGDDRPACARSVVAVGTADGDRSSRNHCHDGVLQEKIHAETEASACVDCIKNPRAHARQEPRSGHDRGYSLDC